MREKIFSLLFFFWSLRGARVTSASLSTELLYILSKIYSVRVTHSLLPEADGENVPSALCTLCKRSKKACIRFACCLCRLILTFGDFGIAELFLLNKKWLVKRRHKKLCTHKLIPSPNVRISLEFIAENRGPQDCERENQIRQHYQVASEPVIGPHRFPYVVQQPVQQRRRISVIESGPR